MKKNSWKIGLLQAVGVVAYVLLITALMNLLQLMATPSSDFVAASFMLTLLVFSAAATGSMVFGYPAFLMFNKKTKEAVRVFGFTMLFLFLAASLILLAGAKFM